MPVMSSRNNRRNQSERRSAGRTIHATGGNRKQRIPLARESDIPAGEYRSSIIGISDTTTISGKEAAEVIYELRAANGKSYKMREIVPYDSYPFDRFCNDLIAAGLQDGSDLSAAVGITEDVTLSYPDTGGLGHFSKRTPVVEEAEAAPTPDEAADDDEPVSNFDDDEIEEEDWLELED